MGGRERSRSRSPVPHNEEGEVDWSRHRGKTDAELIEELRERQREGAVCSDRKGYAKRLPRFESVLATNREKGPAESKLIEESEGYFGMAGLRGRRGMEVVETSGQAEESLRRRTFEEDELRKRRMKDIYEKYGSTASRETSTQGRGVEVEGAELMRLG